MCEWTHDITREVEKKNVKGNVWSSTRLVEMWSFEQIYDLFAQAA